MAKTDIKSAFRLLPINPSGFNSLGFQFNNKYYFNMCLPMGFTFSCYYYELHSSFLNWVVDREIDIVASLHYLDDFLFIGKSGSQDCLLASHIFIKISEFFAIPLTSDKTVFPCISEKIEFCLPESKILRIKNLLKTFLSLKKITLRELQSLLGLLVSASHVIPMGRTFSKRFYRATCGAKSPFAHIQLTKNLKDDLWIWLAFVGGSALHKGRGPRLG